MNLFTVTTYGMRCINKEMEKMGYLIFDWMVLICWLPRSFDVFSIVSQSLFLIQNECCNALIIYLFLQCLQATNLFGLEMWTVLFPKISAWLISFCVVFNRSNYILTRAEETIDCLNNSVLKLIELLRKTNYCISLIKDRVWKMCGDQYDT